MQFITPSIVLHLQLLIGIRYRSYTEALTKAEEKCGKCNQILVYTLTLSTVFIVRVTPQLIIN